MVHNLIKATLGTSLLLAAPALKAAECGTVTIADMNWNSASLMAYVDQFILEYGYGCEVELVPGDTEPTGVSMIEKGQPDVAPELWSNSMKEPLDKAVADNRLRVAGSSLSDGGEEGFWVPAYMVEEYPELTTIEGVIKHAELFEHPEDPELSAVMGCPAGWSCQNTTGNLFEALKLEDEGFELIDPGSGAGLAGAITKAYERKQPWFGYYWAPTALLGKYKMVMVDFGTGVDAEEFRNCTTQPDCLEPKVTMYPPGPVSTLTTADFAERAPEAFEYLSNRSYTNEQMNELLAWMEDNQADGEYATEYFLENYQQTWIQWLPEEIAEKVLNAL